jgi:type IV pilus assembly protein PilO
VGLSGKNIKRRIAKISKVYRLIVIIALNIAAFVPLFMFVITPQLETKQSLMSEYDELKKNLDKMVLIKNNMEKYRKEYAEVQQALQDVLRQLPETKDIPNLLRSISAVGGETRIKVRYLEPKTLQNKEFFAELPFEIRYAGGYHNLAYFFDSVRKLERIVNVVSFSLEVPAKADPGKLLLEGRATARTYVYLKDQPKTKKVEKSEPAKK